MRVYEATHTPHGLPSCTCSWGAAAAGHLDRFQIPACAHLRLWAGALTVGQTVSDPTWEAGQSTIGLYFSLSRELQLGTYQWLGCAFEAGFYGFRLD